MKGFFKRWLILTVVLMTTQATIAQNDAPTDFTNQGGVINTRHNMMQSTQQTYGGGTMNPYRNNYGEVCVYCHTPHGANASAAVPLWNRTLPTTTYTTYDKLNTSTLTQTVSQPGGASLVCLSCHDGQQAVDAIINMPGSGQYDAAARPWTYLATTGTSKSVNHAGLSISYTNAGVVGGMFGSGTSCMSCHNPNSGQGAPGDATDFTIFNTGTDLRNDHPVGVNFPTTSGAGTDWMTPGGSVTRGSVVTRFFDEDANGRMDKGDIRLYGSGTDSRVECASCHDPHGVPSAGAGSTFNPTFLRKMNTGSAVCMTCHNK